MTTAKRTRACSVMDRTLFKFVLVLLLQYRFKLLIAQCSDHNVRLVNGTAPYEGRVEVCSYNMWMTVCEDHWTIDEARVICMQLGYSCQSQDVIALPRTAYGEGCGPIIEIHCFHFEERLSLDHCHIHDFAHRHCRQRDAGLRCLCCKTEGEVRLQGGINNYSGRVEVCLNGTWGYVCATEWDSTDASIVCRQLGYSKFNSIGTTWRYYGNYTARASPTHLNNVRCIGNEQSLIDCFHINGSSQSCSYTSREKHAAVTCEPRCQDGELRLWGSNVPNTGTVEICINKTWGAISNNYWDKLDATVACRQLGYSEKGATGGLFQDQYRHGNLSVYLTNVSCIGNETNIIDCQHDRVSTDHYAQSTMAGVLCQLSNIIPAPETLEVTLDESNNCRLSWDPPHISRRHGSIMGYLINCSTQDDDVDIANTTSNAAQILLRPHAEYNCCVFAVNEIAEGHPICKTLTTYESAPSASPTSIASYSLNSTSFFLSWNLPLARYRNGIIRGYNVKIMDISATINSELNYISEETYLYINNLNEDVKYTCKIAAYTSVGVGPFSKPIIITKHFERDSESLLLSLTSAGGVTTFIVFISVIVHIVIWRHYRKHKPNKESRCSTPSPVYEMVDISRNDSSINTNTENKRHSKDQNTDEVNPRNETHSISPDPTRNTSRHTNPYYDTVQCTHGAREENVLYQPLIPMRPNQATVSTEYQSLSQLTAAKGDSSPPPLPPKPNKLY